MDVLTALDAAAVRAWSRAACRALRAHRAEIDALNVYPVPDGDTGTNLLATVEAGAHALGEDGPSTTAAAAARALARGAALGARGSSGVIVAGYLQGWAEALPARPDAGAEDVRAALRAGARAARAAVSDPVEGTVLSIADAAAEAAGQPPDAELGDLLGAAVRAAEAALAATPGQLDALGRAGVVDAGGLGLVVLLDALGEVVTGAPLRRPPDPDRPGPDRIDPDRLDPDRLDPDPPAAAADPFGLDADPAGPAYEVAYLLDADEPAGPALEALRATLDGLGDTVAVAAAGPGTWTVHAHVDDIGAAIEAGVRAGRPHRIRVTRFADALETRGGGVAVVAVAPGAALAHLFESEGAVVVEVADRPEELSVAEVLQTLRALRAAGSPEAILLPNAEAAGPVAAQAAAQARAGGMRVAVVPTRSPVQGLAAVAVHSGSARFDDLVVAMAEAAAATRYAEVTIARSEGLTSVGPCQPGDVLGLIDGEVVEIGRGVVAVAFAVVDRLLGVGGELMTVLVGVDAAEGLGEVVAAHIRDRAPYTEVGVYPGGPPDVPLILGVE